MALRLFNTLSGKLEDFQPLEPGRVRMYACGPTVYDYGHIGNFRTFIFVDLLARFLRQSGFELQDVMNITDVDDRIIENSAKLGVTVGQYTEKYEAAFHSAKSRTSSLSKRSESTRAPSWTWARSFLESLP